jgi:hypothetical protein
MSDLMVWRHRPHTEPAPQRSATSLVVVAPSSIAWETAALVAPVHRQTYI